MMGRRLTVWLAALFLRHGLEPAQLLDALSKSHRHRDSAWRMAVLEDAQARNH